MLGTLLFSLLEGCSSFLTFKQQLPKEAFPGQLWAPPQPGRGAGTHFKVEGETLGFGRLGDGAAALEHGCEACLSHQQLEEVAFICAVHHFRMQPGRAFISQHLSCGCSQLHVQTGQLEAAGAPESDGPWGAGPAPCFPGRHGCRLARLSAAGPAPPRGGRMV